MLSRFLKNSWMILSLIFLVSCGGGQSDTPNDTTADNTPTQKAIQSMSIDSGPLHVCAVLLDQTVSCWGNNEYGQLGNGSFSQGPAYEWEETPTKVKDVNNVIQVSTGGIRFTCVLHADKTVSCWGYVPKSPLYEAFDPKNYTPLTKIPGLANVSRINVGLEGACAILEDKTVSCWEAFNTPPTPIKNLSNVKQISMGDIYGIKSNCALLEDGTVHCWRSYLDQPKKVENLSDVNQISSNYGEFACALLNNGSIKCWGDNLTGRLGNGSVDFADFLTPVAVQDIAEATQVDIGGIHACALLKDKTVKCWGSNEYGQLGDPNIGIEENRRFFSPEPVVVPNLKNVKEISAGFWHTCALLADNKVQCWGFGTNHTVAF